MRRHFFWWWYVRYCLKKITKAWLVGLGFQFFAVEYNWEFNVRNQQMCLFLTKHETLWGLSSKQCCTCCLGLQYSMLLFHLILAHVSVLSQMLMLTVDQTFLLKHKWQQLIRTITFSCLTFFCLFLQSQQFQWSRVAIN